ncbi:MAG TPA: hypothetical protein PLB38_00695 [bacterium]|nr:hypothetical protein [bacterium]
MLEHHNLNVSPAKPDSSTPARRSRLWLPLALLIFAIIIFSVLYVLLRARFVYLPVLSEQFGGTVAPEYRLPTDSGETADLTWQNWSQKDGFTVLTFSEAKATELLRKYFDSKWQIILKDGGFEIFGPLYTAVNNDEYWSEVKVLFVSEKLIINLNGMDVPERLNNYLLNYIISSDEASEKSFEKVVFSAGEVAVYFSKDQAGTLLKNFNAEDFFKNLIQYLLYQN